MSDGKIVSRLPMSPPSEIGSGPSRPVRRHYAMVVDTAYGRMLINRFDINQAPPLLKYGVCMGHSEVELMGQLLNQIEGDNKVLVDVGACYGTYSFGLRNYIGEHGKIYTFEPQRILYNMICGSVAVNSIENIYVINKALGSGLIDTIDIPKFDYGSPLSFGSIEFGGSQMEKLSQKRGESTETVNVVTLDSCIEEFKIDRLDLIKIDVEGMETDVLKGSVSTVHKFRPMMFVEFVKSDKQELREILESWEYNVQEINGMNFLATPMELGQVV